MATDSSTLPPGFRMTVRSAQTLPGSAQPVDHLVFTDGMASVSVFVEMQQSAPQPAAGQTLIPVAEAATVGSSSAFSTVVDGHKITSPALVVGPAARILVDGHRATSREANGHIHYPHQWEHIR